MKTFRPELLSSLSCFLEGQTVAERAGAMILNNIATLGLVNPEAARHSSGHSRDTHGVGKECCATICAYAPLIDDLGFKASTAKIASLGEDDAPDGKRLAGLMDELKERLYDECESSTFFAMDQREAAYYTAPLTGWKELINRFPAIGDDVEESSKCMALSRYAAAVFHSVQIVEFGLIELGTFIG